jgi:putative PIN family toxin of toxin-antitoxin system
VKIFLDTNVLASAIGTRGLCREIVESVLEAHELIVPPTLLSELERTLDKKFGFPQELIAKWRDLLLSESTQAYVLERLQLPLKDRSDIVLLSDAAAGKAAIFITGDRELLSAGKLETMEIISPRTYWERFNPRRVAAVRPAPSKKDR